MGCAALRDKKNKCVTVLILGLDQSGKSTYLYSLDGTEDLEGYHPTQTLNMFEINRDKIKIRFYDLGGAANLRVKWFDYFTEKDGIFYFVDASNEQKFSESTTEFKRIMDNDFNKECPVFIFLSKTDKATESQIKKIEEMINDTCRSENNQFKIYKISSLKKKILRNL